MTDQRAETIAEALARTSPEAAARYRARSARRAHIDNQVAARAKPYVTPDRPEGEAAVRRRR